MRTRILGPAAILAVGLPLLVSSAFAQSSTSGRQLHKLTANDAAENSAFGFSVALDGNLAVVGAQTEGGGRGAAYLFDALTGKQLHKLYPDDPPSPDWFGWSVAVNGNTVVVGAPRYELSMELDNVGAVYVFDAVTGSQTMKLVAPDPDYFDEFGLSVAVNDKWILVGKVGDDDNGRDSGAAYAFDRETGNLVMKLNPTDAAAGDYFGVSVALDGDLALIGAFFDDAPASSEGSAYLFDLSTGEELMKLVASDGEHDDQFGISVAMSHGKAVVGSWLAETAYVFDTATGEELRKIHFNRSTFGRSVGLVGDLAVVGAPFTGPRGEASGAGYLADVRTGTVVGDLIARDGSSFDKLGFTAAVSGNKVILGAPNDADDGYRSGSAYIFGIGYEEAAFDIRPGSCPNHLSYREQGLLPAAVLGSDSFDVRNIDVSSLRLMGVAPRTSAVKDLASPAGGEGCPCAEGGRDGHDDLEVKFPADELLESLGNLEPGETLELTLLGAFEDGTPFVGYDCVEIQGSRGDVENIRNMVYSWQLHLSADGNVTASSRQISYEIPDASRVHLGVFDVSGRKVTDLVQTTETEGAHAVSWNTTGVPSGIYFLRLRTETGTGSAKLAVLH